MALACLLGAIGCDSPRVQAIKGSLTGMNVAVQCSNAWVESGQRGRRVLTVTMENHGDASLQNVRVSLQNGVISESAGSAVGPPGQRLLTAGSVYEQFEQTMGTVDAHQSASLEFFEHWVWSDAEYRETLSRLAASPPGMHGYFVRVTVNSDSGAVISQDFDYSDAHQPPSGEDISAGPLDAGSDAASDAAGSPGGNTFQNAQPAVTPAASSNGLGSPVGSGAVPSPSAPENRLQEAAAALNAFYDSVNRKDYGAAYSLLSAEWQREQPYSRFQAGYGNTDSVSCRISDSRMIGDNAVEISVTLDAVEGGRPARWSGTYQLVRSSEGWRLDRGRMRRL